MIAIAAVRNDGTSYHIAASTLECGDYYSIGQAPCFEI